MPCESTKIFVCTNPETEGSDKDQLNFSWGDDYTLFWNLIFQKQL